jgi:hypothetical protein
VHSHRWTGKDSQGQGTKDRQLAIWMLFSETARITGTFGQTAGIGEKEL